MCDLRFVQGRQKRIKLEIKKFWQWTSFKPVNITLWSVKFFLASFLPGFVYLGKFSTGIVITSITGVAVFARAYMRISDRIVRNILLFWLFWFSLSLLTVLHLIDLLSLLILII